ncbi:MAG: hypothetical protein Q8O37_06260 [Sulfuricellaceae bacterium]|nr:hypothetical protein [Sulfuricellaceae bacterium]
MSKAEQRISKIRDTQIGATAKKVLLVEGSDDVSAFRQLLNRRVPDWESRWALAEAGNKRQALDMAPLVLDWLVLVDRDEWSANEVKEFQQQHANLFVLPRFCLESYLVDPAELWEALPPKQQEKIPTGASGIETEVLASLADWRRHAALWHVINPLWSGLRALGFKEGLLQTQKIPNDAELERTLKSWSEFVDHKRILDEVHVAIGNMNAQTATDFLHLSLYAKDFYPQVVHPALDRLLGRKSEAERRIALFRTLPIPADIDPLWKRMGLV